MFHSPWFLCLLVLVPFVAWRLWRKNADAAVVYSSLLNDAVAPRTMRQRLTWVPGALTLLALTLMIIALARPREGRQQTIIESEGIAIEMIVDRSGSMQAMDFKIDQERVDRLTAIKNVASKFVNGKEQDQTFNGNLDGRASDLIGLITFAGYVDAITPPTLDHHFLVSQLDDLQIVDVRSEDGTAIGDAISLATAKLNALDDRRDQKVKSKIAILLTDGENTAGEIEPTQAAELAKKMGVRIYTIGVGTRGQAPYPVRSGFTGRVSFQMMNVNIDEDTLKSVASLTGGKYFRATDTESLSKIYEEIDLLEKTKIEAKTFVDYRELAVQTISWRALQLPPLVLVSIILIAGRVILEQTLFRRFV